MKRLSYDDKNSLVTAIKYLFTNETVLSDSMKNLFAIWQTHQQCILDFIGQNNTSTKQQTVKTFYKLRMPIT